MRIILPFHEGSCSSWAGNEKKKKKNCVYEWNGCATRLANVTAGTLYPIVERCEFKNIIAKFPEIFQDSKTIPHNLNQHMFRYQIKKLIDLWFVWKVMLIYILFYKI